MGANHTQAVLTTFLKNEKDFFLSAVIKMIIIFKWFSTAITIPHNLVFREGPHPAGRDGALANRASAHDVRDPVRVPSAGRTIDVS